MPDRLFLRPFAEDDADSFYETVMSDPDLSSVFGLDHAAQLSDAADYVSARAEYAGRPRFYDYLIIRRSDGAAIGEINAAYIHDDLADIGYVIASPFRHCGYGQEAVNLLCRILQAEGVKRIYGACRRENSASKSLMRACGMHETPAVPDAVKMRETEQNLVWFTKKL